jgi:argininosuccinate synthase
VHTVFADTGGVDAEERAYIEQRAAELGVASHVTVDGGPAIWNRASSSPSCGRARATRASIRCWCRIAI